MSILRNISTNSNRIYEAQPLVCKPLSLTAVVSTKICRGISEEEADGAYKVFQGHFRYGIQKEVSATADACGKGLMTSRNPDYNAT
ncbi:MAG: hypothetical protein Q7T53_12860 [Deltaproteobacteria bacterium]|nr:hypothetical protein [Deltaproteobacteria bacterium]